MRNRRLWPLITIIYLLTPCLALFSSFLTLTCFLALLLKLLANFTELIKKCAISNFGFAIQVLHIGFPGYLIRHMRNTFQNLGNHFFLLSRLFPSPFIFCFMDLIAKKI